MSTREVTATTARGEAGFTLIEVLIATAIFVFVAAAGFETLRQFGSVVTLLGTRANAAAALATATGQLRSDAVSATAVWIPHASCGTAISMLQRNAAGTSFTTYVVRNGSLLRTTAPGPIDPCRLDLQLDVVLAGVTAMTSSEFLPSTLPAHVDPIGGNGDGGLFRAGAIVSVAVDSHDRDYDGTPIATGNQIVEVNLDADPAAATIDLVAGNRPSGYTDVLTYACGARCAANTTFPEIASLDESSCTALAPDLPDTSEFYAPHATAVGAAGRIVTANYAIHVRYGFAFAGASAPVTAERLGPTFVWPATANLSDAYPVDYANNAVRSAGAAALAAFAGPPANLAASDALCAAMDTESDFHG